MNTGARLPSFEQAEQRVHRMQTKLHQWAISDPDRCFDDLFNLVHDPAFLVVAWNRIRSNKGARTAGVDGVVPRSIRNVEGFLSGLRGDLKARRFRTRSVREHKIPKAGGRTRRLGIPTAADRVVQTCVMLVIEPIFEADFKPCSHGFRPKRRAQDAIAEIHFFGSRGYEWVLEGDIEACFDEIDHVALMSRVRRRVGDKRLLSLVKAFLRAGVLTEEGLDRTTITGVPQGGTLSPLLANITLSVLDEHFMRKWEELGPSWMRASRRRRGEPTMRLVRYADDFVVMVNGSREHAEALRDKVEAVLQSVGLRLSKAKTKVCDLNEGFDFLGWRIQRRRRRGTKGKKAVYTYPSRRSLTTVMRKVRSLTRRHKHRTLADLLVSVNRVLRGWCNYFRHGVCAKTFGYLDHFTWWRIVGWIRKRHSGLNWRQLRSRLLPNWQINGGGGAMFRPQELKIERYRYRGTRIVTPWPSETTGAPVPAA